MLTILIHTSPGIPFIYQGEEMGMVNVQFDSIDDYNCCYTLGDYNAMIAGGISPEEALKVLGPKSRDNARTPYQWNSSENAGFTTGKPWLKVNPRYTEINLEADLASPDSIFAYYQKLTQMRKTCPAIIDGDLQFYLNDHPNVIMYTRRCARQTLLIIANKSDNTLPIQIPQELKQYKWKRLLTNREASVPSMEEGRQWLPWEAEVYTIEI